MANSTHQIPESTKRWLQNESFVLWCLAPTPELDIHWKKQCEEHPELESELMSARYILLSIRLNETKRTEEEAEELWRRINNTIGVKIKTKHRITFYRYAASVLILILGASAWLFLKNPSQKPSSDIAQQTIQNDSVQTEVTLIRSNQEVVEFANNTTLNYDSANNSNNKKMQTEQQNQLIVPYGRRSSIILSDGTKVWINSGSKLTFPSKFAENYRKINVDGEIYIEVAKDATRPFYVESERMTVNVLGTKFNISAYKNDASHSVVLEEGKVNVNLASEKPVMLSPNQRFQLIGEQIDISKVNASDFIAWKDGLMNFNGETLKDATQRLSRYYNVTISCAPAVAEKRLVGKLVLFDDIEQVMETFSILYDIDCHFETGKIRIE